MKNQLHGKFLAILAVLSLALLVGCGDKVADDKTQAEIKKIDDGLKEMPPVPDDQKDAMGGVGTKPKR